MFYTSLLVAANKEDTIDPTNILKQVISARLKIPPSIIKLEIINKHTNFGNSTSTCSVVFDGSKRRFEYKNGDVVIYDGKKIISYTPSLLQRIELISLSSADSPCPNIFDPSTIGINPVCFISYTVQSALPIENAESVILIGKEMVETNSVWHIQITPGAKWGLPSVFKIDVWIDNQLRIHRYLCNGLYSYSYYDEKISKDLPYRVVSFPRDKRLIIELIIQEFRHFPKRPDDSIWTLKGVNIPKGTEVVDNQAKVRIGYWDGTKIVKSFTELNAKKSKPVSIWILVPAVLLLFLIPLCIYAVKRIKNKSIRKI